MVTLLSETFPFPVHCQVYHVLIKISKHVCFAVSAVLNFCCNWRTFQGHRQWRVHYFQADSQLNFPNWTRNRKIWTKTLKICVKTGSKNAWLTQWWSSENSIPKDYEHANLTNLICTVYSTLKNSKKVIFSNKWSSLFIAATGYALSATNWGNFFTSEILFPADLIVTHKIIWLCTTHTQDRSRLLKSGPAM